MIRLGYVLNDVSNKKIFYLNPSYLNRHVCIFGTTGSGKSSTLSVIAYELKRLGIPIFILDRTGEYAKRLKEHATVFLPGKNFSISPFRIWDNLDVEEKVQNEMWLLNEYCKITWGEDFTPLQSRLITEALLKIYSRKTEASFENLIREIRNIAEKELKIWLESAESIVSRFRIFTIGTLRKAFFGNFSQNKEIIKCLNNMGILDLSIFEHEEPKNMFSLLIATLLYLEFKNANFSSNIKLAVAIDEAQNLLGENDKHNIVVKMAMELRKYGLSLLLISPRASNIPENILSNCSTIIVHQLLSSYDIDIIKRYACLSSMKYSLENVLFTLKQGEAFVRSPDCMEGEIIKVGLPEHESFIKNEQ